MFIILIIKLNILNNIFFFTMLKITYPGELNSTAIIKITSKRIISIINF
jgi:hypothetical protein